MIKMGYIKRDAVWKPPSLVLTETHGIKMNILTPAAPCERDPPGRKVVRDLGPGQDCWVSHLL